MIRRTKMPHTRTYDKMESVDHIIIRFDNEGDMRVTARVKLKEKGSQGNAERHVHNYALRPGQKEWLTAIVRDIGASLDVEIPIWAKEKKQ